LSIVTPYLDVSLYALCWLPVFVFMEFSPAEKIPVINIHDRVSNKILARYGDVIVAPLPSPKPEGGSSATYLDLILQRDILQCRERVPVISQSQPSDINVRGAV
jgi:hypothetical protein